MKKPILVALLVFLFSTKAQMQDGILDQELMERVNLEFELKQKLNGQLNYDMLFNIPVISPIKPDSIRRISDVFGKRECHPVLKIPSFHSGIDFSANIRTPVLATANGVVVDVRYSKRGYGNKVVLQHDFDYRTLYAHLNDIDVSIGDTVKIGQTIGTVGSTGLSTGPHLHYEVQLSKKPIDPLSLYQIDLEKEDKVKDYLAFLNDFESVVYSNI